MAHEICWGTVIKGATIAAGAALLGIALMPAAPTIAAWGAAHAGAGIGAWIATHVASVGSWILGHEIKTLAIGAVIGGLAADVAQRKDENKEAAFERAEQQANNNSFAAREDMRKMQALMVARMQAQGYEPAMAMAGQQR